MRYVVKQAIGGYAVGDILSEEQVLALPTGHLVHAAIVRIPDEVVPPKAPVVVPPSKPQGEE